ncbi:MAG: molecular chaperone DnaJ [Parcubacteria group bacterium]|nr:molecular chaperone DnaJ [Parcubacteria group bacterium]
MAKDYYQILGVSKSANQDEIKKAFRKKAHELHPDKAGGDEAKFKELNEAYQILGNAEKRTQYDRFGDSAFSGQGFGGTGMNWNDFVRQAQGQGFGAGGFNVDLGDLGDIFSEVFGFGGGRRSRQRSGPQQGESMEIEMSIDFLDAVFGAERTIRLNRVTKCSHCKGNGAEPGTKISSCNRCGGSGQIVHTRSTLLGTFQSATVCPECRGEGKSAENPCKECSGQGVYERPEEVKIKIPAGIDNGQTVIMSGLGHAGEHGGQPGDLYIHIRVKSHKRFERDGYDIITREPLSVSQAVLGDTVQVETVHGPVNLKIPAGTQAGTRFKLRDKGVPHVHASSKGDHIVVADVIIPSKLSRKEKKLYEELRDAKGKGWL